MGNSINSFGPQAFTVPGTGISGIETPSWRNIYCQENNHGELVSTQWPGVTTLHEAFMYVILLEKIIS